MVYVPICFSFQTDINIFIRNCNFSFNGICVFKMLKNNGANIQKVPKTDGQKYFVILEIMFQIAN